MIDLAFPRRSAVPVCLSLPAALREVVKRALQLQPAQRQADAAELGQELEQVARLEQWPLGAAAIGARLAQLVRRPP